MMPLSFSKAGEQNMIVRVGGYSEYFNRLSPALKAAVLERNIHEA